MKFNKENIIDLLIVVLGNLVLSAGVALFIIPNDILSGGVAGIAIAIQPLTGIEPQITINVLTIVFFIIGSLILGKKFATKTLVSSILYPTFLTMFTVLSNGSTLTDNPLLASLYGGACIGIGVGLVFRSGASTGGMDIPPLIINKYTGWSLPTLVLVVDALTVLLGASIFGIEPALIGLIAVAVSSTLINKMIVLGAHQSKSVMIISEYYPELISRIQVEISRGVTILEAEGGYSKSRKPVLMVVISKKQYHDLKKLVDSIDQDAFMIVSDVNDVHGLGFTYKEQM